MCAGRKCILGDLVRLVNGRVKKRLGDTKVGQLAGAFEKE